ncbi:MAG: hypothetical protein AB4368_19930 [Xenococcaceae cyanobacterium]
MIDSCRIIPVKMTLMMATQKQKSNQIIILDKEERISLKSKQEILLLLKELAEREETTVKLILDRLYDLGALNIINNKLRSRALKVVVRRLAKLSKPTFRVIGFYWFKRNCPRLITNWLVTQVAFERAEGTIKDIVEVSDNSLEVAALADLKVRQLRSRVRLLTNILVIVIALSAVSFAWLLYSLKEVKPASIERAAALSNNCLDK